jgi:hypothetical protein
MSLSLEDYVREHGPKIGLPEILRLIESSAAKPSPKQILHLLQEQSEYTGIRILPRETARLMAAIGKQYSPHTIIDINCRVGQVLHYCTYAQTRLGIDRNPQLIRLASYLYPKVKFMAGDILNYEIDPDFNLIPSEQVAPEQAQLPLPLDDTSTQLIRRAFDLIITALPFGQRIRHGGRNEPFEKLLLERALNLLGDEGVVVVLSPVNILTASLYEAFRKQVLQHFALDMVASLPAGTLLHTSVPSCILVIRNGKPNDTVYLAEYQRNTPEIIDNLRNGTGSLQIPLNRIHNRWDRHFFDPRFDEIDAILQGENVKRLDDISKAIIRGYPFKSDERHEAGDYLILTPRRFRQGRIETRTTKRDHYATANASERFKRCIVQEGDILVGLISDPAVYIYKEDDPPAVAGSNVAIIRSHDSKYIGAYLQTTAGLNLFLSQADRKTAGATIRYLTIRDLKNIRIPILPLADLYAVSDEGIHTASVDELEALKQELALPRQRLVDLATHQADVDKPTPHLIREALAVYQAQDLQSMAQESLLPHQILAFASFVDERFNRVDAALQALHAKAEQILALVQRNQLEIRRIKRTPRCEEEKLLRIYSGLNDIVDWVVNQRRTMQEYTEIVQHWLERWEILHKASQQFLSSAEFLFDEIGRVEGSDYSPFIIQYCRALENEILIKLFEAYHVDFHCRIEDPEQFLLGDLADKSEKTVLFARRLKRDNRAYTLGQMSRIMQLIKPGGRTLGRSIVLQDFRAFALRHFQVQIVDEEYLERIQMISENYRNRSAHPNVLGIQIALECQTVIRSTLNEFLVSYLADGKQHAYEVVLSAGNETTPG